MKAGTSFSSAFCAARKRRCPDMIEDQFFNEGWSLDSAVGNAKVKGLFTEKEMVCTKTLYNYVDLGLLKIKNDYSALRKT